MRQYATEHGFPVYSEYVDDGYSGTNFDRPAFQRMMADVDAGKINCIITKDLSRFGREHVKMDYYLEFVFPEKNVRYIAVTDNEDTENGLSDFVPFKNLFNEWYARDTSRKVKSAFHAKFTAGEHICTLAPLGYKRDPEIKNKLVIDEETRWIIEKIFDMASHGAGPAKIARALRREKVPTAGWINYKRFGAFARHYDGQPEEKAYAWSITHVRGILSNEVYIGNSIHGKYGHISYKNKKTVRKPEDEWLCVENTHEGIISREVFEQVQGQIASRRRQQKDTTTQIFAGLLKCADCGRAMCIATNGTGEKRYRYFVCSNYRRFSKKLSGCASHYIRYDLLYTYVLARIRYWSQQVQIGEEKLLQQLLNAGDKECAAAAKKQTAERKKAEKRKAEVDRLFVKLYEDWSAGRISEYNFNMLSQKYQTEQQELIEKLDRLNEELASEQQTVTDTEKWIKLIKQYANPTELTAELLNTLIEKIVIHEPEWDERELYKSQEIEIYYRFIGKID